MGRNMGGGDGEKELMGGNSNKKCPEREQSLHKIFEPQWANKKDKNDCLLVKQSVFPFHPS